MSSYERTKAIRYKLKPEEIEMCREAITYDNTTYEEISTDTIAHKFKIEDSPYKNFPCFCSAYGINQKR